ncbi:MAG: hypothetical protein AB8B97_24095 [Granulosicoccus sp.]
MERVQITDCGYVENHAQATELNCTVTDIMEKLDERVTRFLVQALQLDAFTMQLEHEIAA